jgi:hypothetical protein
MHSNAMHSLAGMLDGSITSFAFEVPRTTTMVFVGVALVGFVRSAAVPVLYEAAAELTYPLPEGTSAGMIVIAEHLSLLSLLFAVPHMGLRLVNLLCLCALGACPLILFFYRSQYLRLDTESKMASAAPPQRAVRKLPLEGSAARGLLVNDS